MTIPTDHVWSDDLAAAAAKGYSQYGEEGVIARLFADLGTTNRCLVDIGAGDGRALSNTQALIDAGWHGARFDCAYDAAGVVRARITAENVCDVLAKHNVPGEPDFLSLDIDGVDWWVLRAVLRAYQPRAFICEINPSLARLPAVTVPYDPGFTFSSCIHFGASLGAFEALGAAYGYACVYVHEAINAVFVRRDLLPPGVRLSVAFAPRQSWPPDPHGRPWHLIAPTELS